MSGAASVEGLRTAFEAAVRAFEAGDLDSHLALMHDDVTYSVPDYEDPLVGKPAVRAMYERMFTGVESVVWESIEPVFVVAGPVGMVFSRFSVTFKVQGQAETQREGRHIVVFAAINDEWVRVGEQV